MPCLFTRFAAVGLVGYTSYFIWKTYEKEIDVFAANKNTNIKINKYTCVLIPQGVWFVRCREGQFKGTLGIYSENMHNYGCLDAYHNCEKYYDKNSKKQIIVDNTIIDEDGKQFKIDKLLVLYDDLKFHSRSFHFYNCERLQGKLFVKYIFHYPGKY